MPLNKTLQREFEVAFSKHAQPVWFRVLKYFLLGCLVYFLWGSKWLWVVLSVLLVGGLALHFWFRYKTKGWTQSYGAWNYDKNKPHK